MTAEFSKLNWKALGIIFLSVGASNALTYLKRSPLPGIGNP